MKLEIEINFPLYVLFPESTNQVMDKISLMENGLILIESAGLFYEQKQVDKSMINWEFYLSLPRVSDSQFERRKKWIIEHTPDKVL